MMEAVNRIPMRYVMAPVTIKNGPKVYGRVRYRSGRQGFRKYSREVRGGLSAVEVFVERAERAHHAISGVSDVMLGPRP